MKYQQFLSAVSREMQAAVQDGESVTIHTVLKNNGIKMKAMSIRHDAKEVCPMIYMAPFYRMYLSGRRMEDIVSELKNLYQMDVGQPADSRVFFHFQAAKQYLAYRIISCESNGELLRQVPYRRVLDFALVYYLSLEGKDETRGSAMVYNDHIKIWNVTEEELYAQAVSNMPSLLPVYTESLDHVLEGLLLPKERPMDGVGADGVFVISNRYNFYGAAAVFYPGVLKELTGAMECDLYLLPSSVHEFLALPVSCGIEPDELQALVTNINMTHVAPEEVLSNRIYRYDRTKDRIFML